jgi:hypothetical protein
MGIHCWIESGYVCAVPDGCWDPSHTGYDQVVGYSVWFAIDGTGSAIDGTGSAIDGTGSAIDGTGSAIGGTGSAIGGTGNAIGGTGNAIGGTGNAIGGTGNAIGGTGNAIGSFRYFFWISPAFAERWCPSSERDPHGTGCPQGSLCQPVTVRWW